MPPAHPYRRCGWSPSPRRRRLCPTSPTWRTPACWWRGTAPCSPRRCCCRRVGDSNARPHVHARPHLHACACVRRACSCGCPARDGPQSRALSDARPRPRPTPTHPDPPPSRSPRRRRAGAAALQVGLAQPQQPVRKHDRGQGGPAPLCVAAKGRAVVQVRGREGGARVGRRRRLASYHTPTTAGCAKCKNGRGACGGDRPPCSSFGRNGRGSSGCGILRP